MTAEVFQEEIKTLMNVDNVNILSLAVTRRIFHLLNLILSLNMAIAAVIGLMVGVGILFY